MASRPDRNTNRGLTQPSPGSDWQGCLDSSLAMAVWALGTATGAEGGDTDHMTVLAALSRRLMRAEFTDTLLNATDPAAVADYVRAEVTP